MVTDADDRAAIQAESDATKLRNEWVDLIRADMAQIEASAEQSVASVDPESFLGTFMRSLPVKKSKPKSADHPRGETATRNDDSDDVPDLIEVSDSDSDSSSASSSEDSSDVREQPM